MKLIVVDKSVDYKPTAYQKLVGWLVKLTDNKTDQIMVYNALDESGKRNDVSLYQIEAGASTGWKVIALSQKASQILKSRKISHFVLPSPNTRNGKLKTIDSQLEVCYNWLRGNV